MKSYSKIVEQHIPCPVCPSSDAYCLYEDGHGHCFSCGYHKPANYKEEFIPDNYTYEYLPVRGIEATTLRKYDVKTKINSTGKPIAVGFTYPSGRTKVRALADKTFYWTNGDQHSPGLFGSDKFSAGEHKYIVITEGEYDALTLFQLLRVPVVSVQSSSSGVSDCVHDRAYLNGFDRIYLALDNDAKGRECARGIAKLFDFNKVWQLKFTKYKDANEYLLAGEGTELLNIWNNARKYQPEQIISSFSEFEKILTEPHKPSVPYPFPSLNEMLYGIRTGETVLITAQEGIGKTEFMHHILYKLLKETDDGIGAIFIEEPKARLLQAVAGLELRKPVHLPDSGVSTSEVITALQRAVVQDQRLHIYSHFGTDDADSILDTIRFMVTALECRHILFDHISMAVSGVAGEDERKALDYLSTRLEMMVKELDFALIMVSHVNDEGKTRGSRYISKVADIRVDIARDTGASDPIIRNTTAVSVSKNRFSGKTGPACKLLFDPETYTYSEIESDAWGKGPLPFLEEASSDGSSGSIQTYEAANDNQQSQADQRRAA